MGKIAGDRYRTKSILLYVLFWWAAVNITIGVLYVVSSFTPDGWPSVVAAIGGFWFAVATALALFEKIRSSRKTTEYGIRFPGFNGACFPVFTIMKHLAEGKPAKFSNFDLVYSLGEADECLFFLQNDRPKDVATMPLGKLVTAHGQGLTLQLKDIAKVDVIERSDEDIAKNAVDPRDFGERLSSKIAQHATGIKVKTKIIPYAAYVAITSFNENGEAFTLLGVPTTVTAETLAAMGERIVDDSFSLSWLAKPIATVVGSEIVYEANQRLSGVVGEAAADMIRHSSETVSGVVDTIEDVTDWINPDEASVATKDGQRGRRMAQLIALRINQRAGRVALT